MSSAPPPGALLVVIAGSPCQQLTTAGTWGGRQGLAGPDSVLFFAVPAVAAAVTQLRPDVAVATLLEQAGSTLPLHRRAIGEAFGLDRDGTATHGAVVDAGRWGPLPRRRILLSPVPPDPHPWCPPARPAPWAPGWRPHWQGDLQPMMRAHRVEAGLIMARPYQYAARPLLYHEGARWGGMPLRAVVQAISGLMPSERREGWRQLNMGSTRGRHEGPTTLAAEWVARHGEGHGFRAPTLAERSRATGCGAYLEGLDLQDAALYNAQGNFFDRGVVAVRLGRPILGWARGEALSAGPRPRAISELEALYQRVRAAVDDDGIPTQPVGVPVEVQAAAAAGWGGAGRLDATSPAAEDGRGGR